MKRLALIALMGLTLTGCAPTSFLAGGSIVSLYAEYSDKADGLTREAERELIEKLDQRYRD